MRALCDQFLIYFAEPLHGDLLVLNTGTDLVILTEDAAEVAAAEKDRAGTVFTADAGLLSEMRGGADQTGQGRTSAETGAAPVSAEGGTAAGTIVTD